MLQKLLGYLNPEAIEAEASKRLIVQPPLGHGKAFFRLVLWSSMTTTLHTQVNHQGLQQ
jgi:hypothetical protein